jgi:hypothetical protein
MAHSFVVYRGVFLHDPLLAGDRDEDTHSKSLVRRGVEITRCIYAWLCANGSCLGCSYDIYVLENMINWMHLTQAACSKQVVLMFFRLLCK